MPHNLNSFVWHGLLNSCEHTSLCINCDLQPHLIAGACFCKVDGKVSNPKVIKYIKTNYTNHIYVGLTSSIF